MIAARIKALQGDRSTARPHNDMIRTQYVVGMQHHSHKHNVSAPMSMEDTRVRSMRTLPL